MRGTNPNAGFGTPPLPLSLGPTKHVRPVSRSRSSPPRPVPLSTSSTPTPKLGLMSVRSPEAVDSPSASSYFLDVLAQPAPLAAFDAFKKTAPTYKERTARGGILTVLIAAVIALLVWAEAVSLALSGRVGGTQHEH